MSSWGLGSWKRQSDLFRVVLGYGDLHPPYSHSTSETPLLTLYRNGLPIDPSDPSFPLSQASLPASTVTSSGAGIPAPATAAVAISSGIVAPDPTAKCRYRIQLDWTSADEEEQVALKLQSQLMVTLPAPHDEVRVDLTVEEASGKVRVNFGVSKKREALRAISASRTLGGSSPQGDGWGVLTRLMGAPAPTNINYAEELLGYAQHWRSLTILNLSACSLTALPIDISRVPMLEKIFLDNNKLSVLPPEFGQLEHLQVLSLDHNLLVSVPAELKQCSALRELSLEHNKLVRPLLDLRGMPELRMLRLFANPLEFLPEILPCRRLRHLSLANVRIEGNEELSTVNVHIEMETASYFIAAKHKLSAFFALVFRFSSCQHPLLASALAKVAEDDGNRSAIGKDESALRQLLNMMLSENRHVVEHACLTLSALASNATLALTLMKADIMQPIEAVLKASAGDPLIPVLQVVVNLAFASDAVAAKMFTRDLLKHLKILCTHKNLEVQRYALLAIGNMAFFRENRLNLAASGSLREMLLKLSASANASVAKAAMRALAILGENEYLRRAVHGRPVGKRGLSILSMDGGGMRGLATVQMLRRLEKGTGKRIHEMFDLICGTSTGGMLAVALGIKGMSLDECEEIYKSLGKLVFAEPTPKDNEAATWREKLDQLYKSSSQSFRVVVHGSKHNADQFERLLKEICADEDGDLLIESAVKGTPKVFVVSTLVSVMPAQPFVFRNYQYPAGTPEIEPWNTADGPVMSASGVANLPPTQSATSKPNASMGSCKHRIWEAIRASSAAPYYLDDFSCDTNRWQDGAIVANNPTIIAIREAQILWPDTKIGCLISLGCGNLPTKPRGKGGWRYLDTGQVLIESACSVERVEEALDTLLPMIPDMQYFRFNPVDDRCGMELDETDPAVWMKLEAATEEYISANDGAFYSACDCISPPLPEEEQWAERSRHHSTIGKSKPHAKDFEVGPRLGWRRRVFLVEAQGISEPLKLSGHTRTLESFCSQFRIKVEKFSTTYGSSNIAASISTPFASPLFSGSFPGSPLLQSPELGVHHMGHPEIVPPLSLDGHLITGTVTQPIQRSSSMGPRKLCAPVKLLNEKLQRSPQVGIIHMALQNDSVGMILTWQSDIFAVAEPGSSADAFLHTVTSNLCHYSESRQRKHKLMPPKIPTVADLVLQFPKFFVGRAFYRFIGRQTQVLSNEQEVGAYLFQRTLPAVHLNAEDAQFMVGAWRDRIVICTGKYGPPPQLIKAFLEAGAKAVIASSVELPLSLQNPVSDVGITIDDKSAGRFVIGDEEDEEADVDLCTPDSDWEDGDFESCDERVKREEKKETELASFITTFYSAIYRDGYRADIALQKALEAHPKMRYQCHLPNS